MLKENNWRSNVHLRTFYKLFHVLSMEVKQEFVALTSVSLCEVLFSLKI